MFRHRTSIVFLATVLGSLANQELLKDRHRNQNTNSNYNQLYGGYRGSPARDIGKDRDRVTIPGNSPKYDVPMTASLDSTKDHGPIYVVPKYVVRGAGGGSGGPGSGNPSSSVGGPSYNALAEKMVYGDGYDGDICDDPYSTKTVGHKFRYGIDHDSNRRFLGHHRYVEGNDGYFNGNLKSNGIRSGYRRDNNNWSPLERTYLVDSEPAYVVDVQPNYVSNPVTDHNAGYQQYYRTERQPNYPADHKLIRSTEHQPIGQSEPAAYPTVLEPVDDDYDRDYWDTNTNSNVNFNFVSGRRSNVNSNANSNQNSYGGYGPSSGQERYSTTPSYSGYDEDDYDNDRNQRNRGSYGARAPKRNRQSDLRSRPRFNGDNGDEEGDNDIVDDYPSFGNANVNSNTNMNIMSRRNNPRKRRSVVDSVKKFDLTENVDNDGTTEITRLKSTTHGSVA